MRKMHWSEPYLKFVRIEVVFDDGTEQGWDYECSQYESLNDVKKDLANDFKEPDLNRSAVTLSFTQVDAHYSADLSDSVKIHEAFRDEVFDTIEETLNGN